MTRRAPARGDAPDEKQQQQNGPDTPAAASSEPTAAASAAEPERRAPRIDRKTIDRILPANVLAALKLPEHWIPMFAEACVVFGIDPNPSKKPRQLLAHRLISGDPDAVPPEADAISLVTGGGKKIRYPIDNDTERVLREVFAAYVVRAGKREELPLPGDLALPLTALDGMVRDAAHQYRGGYLQSGGKDAADRRDLMEQLRREGRIR